MCPHQRRFGGACRGLRRCGQYRSLSGAFPMVFADAALCQTVPKGILRAGHLSPRGWSLTHRKPTFMQQAFRHKTLGGRLHLIERLSWYHKHRNVHGFLTRTLCFVTRYYLGSYDTSFSSKNVILTLSVGRDPGRGLNRFKLF